VARGGRATRGSSAGVYGFRTAFTVNVIVTSSVSETPMSAHSCGSGSPPKKSATVPVSVGVWQASCIWLCWPFPLPFARENENSVTPTVVSTAEPEKLVGIRWLPPEIVPTPQATELSFDVFVTVIGKDAPLSQVTKSCPRDAIAGLLAIRAAAATSPDAAIKRLMEPKVSPFFVDSQRRIR
jgi:hypothetical protein